MSIQRDGLFYIPTCDMCGHELGDSRTYQDALAEIRKNGWRRVRVDDGYDHLCPDCQQEVCDANV